MLTYIVIAIVIFIAYFFFFRPNMNRGFADLPMDDLIEYINEKNAILIDVRTPKETKQGMIGKPLEIELGPGMQQKMNKLDKSKTYIVYCRSGKRSAIASNMMVKMGFENVHNLTGGYLAYTAKK